MSANISPAFESYLAASGPYDKREALVVYRTPSAESLPVRGRLRELQNRLDAVKERAATQGAVEQRVVADYQKASLEKSRGRRDMAASSVGGATLPVVTVEVTRSTLPELAAQPEVLAIMPNQKIRLIQPRTVGYAQLGKQELKKGMTWGLQELEIPKIWEQTKGEDISVAVLDTGVYADHPALTGRVQDFILVDPLGRRIKAEPAFDSGIHGTHVCGTIAGGNTPDGVAIGVAPKANLFVAGVLVGDATLRTLLEGIAWAIEKGADIINMSLGFTYYEPLFAQVFDILVAQYGILPVVAIGNENHGNTSSPGNAYNAFSVGAVEKTAGSQTDVTFFSSGASLVFPGEQAHALVTKPDVVAPGAQVYSCIPPEKQPDQIYEYVYLDGTSMATPHVAGVAALLMSAKPTAPVAEIVQALKDTARHPKGNANRPDNRWGYGLIQPMEALNAL
jgi:serine protease AprX